MSGRTNGLGLPRLGALFLGAVALLAASLTAERASAQSADSSSIQIQNQPLPPPPGTNETSVLGPGSAASAAPGPIAPPAPEAPSSSATPAIAAPSQWVPEQQAQLTILDKIYGSATQVSAKVGTPFAVRFLTVTVLACWVRPPTLPPDTAAFLQVTDAHAAPGSPPEFRGWILQAEPALSGMNDPATDISVTGCG
jgi:hypothetical protein